jgi:hypothetical protein
MLVPLSRRRPLARLAPLTFGLTLGGVVGTPRSVRADALPNGQDQAHPCRPTISCTADLVAPGTFEAEIGGAVSGTTTGHLASFPLLLKQTLTRFLQVQVGSNGYSVVTDSSSASQLRYVDSVFFGPKVHLRDQGDAWPSLALSAMASVPAFPAEGVARDDDVFLSAYASKDVGVVHVDWNVGADVWRVERAPATQAFTALALSVSPVPPFGLAVEGYYFADAAPVAPHDGGVRVAMSVSPRSWLVADVGGDAGFFPSTRAYTFFFGMTVIPAVLWRPEAPTR